MTATEKSTARSARRSGTTHRCPAPFSSGTVVLTLACLLGGRSWAQDKQVILDGGTLSTEPQTRSEGVKSEAKDEAKGEPEGNAQDEVKDDAQEEAKAAMDDEVKDAPAASASWTKSATFTFAAGGLVGANTLSWGGPGLFVRTGFGLFGLVAVDAEVSAGSLVFESFWRAAVTVGVSPLKWLAIGSGFVRSDGTVVAKGFVLDLGNQNSPVVASYQGVTARFDIRPWLITSGHNQSDPEGRTVFSLALDYGINGNANTGSSFAVFAMLGWAKEIHAQ